MASEDGVIHDVGMQDTKGHDTGETMSPASAVYSGVTTTTTNSNGGIGETESVNTMSSTIIMFIALYRSIKQRLKCTFYFRRTFPKATHAATLAASGCVVSHPSDAKSCELTDVAVFPWP